VADRRRTRQHADDASGTPTGPGDTEPPLDHANPRDL